MTISLLPRVASRVLPCVFGLALLLQGQCARAQIKPVPLQRFLLLGDRKNYVSMQRHIFRTDKEEVYQLAPNNDIRPESSNAYVMAASLPGLVPLYRLTHKTSAGKEFYTISETGTKEAGVKSGYGSKYDIIGYISPIPTPHTVPLYRLYRGVKPKAKYQDVGYYDDHLYTTSESEKQSAVKASGYVYEKIEGYVWPVQWEYTAGGASLDGGYSSPQYKQATKALSAAHELYFGVPADSKRIDRLIGKLWKMSPAMREAFNTGLSALEAARFCRQIIQTDPEERNGVISTVIMAVYGFPRLDFFKDTTGWDEPLKTGKASYLSVLAAETKKLNSDPAKRREMIDRAYIRTMGRKAIDRHVLGQGMQGEQTYWGPRTERFSDIVKANHNWLYSPSGSKDLSETVARALKVKLNRIPTEKEVLFSVKKYTWNRVPFPDMIAPANYPYYESQVLQAQPEPGVKIVGGSGAGKGTGGRPAPPPKP